MTEPLLLAAFVTNMTAPSAVTAFARATAAGAESLSIEVRIWPDLDSIPEATKETQQAIVALLSVDGDPTRTHQISETFMRVAPPTDYRKPLLVVAPVDLFESRASAKALLRRDPPVDLPIDGAKTLEQFETLVEAHIARFADDRFLDTHSIGITEEGLLPLVGDTQLGDEPTIPVFTMPWRRS